MNRHEITNWLVVYLPLDYTNNSGYNTNNSDYIWIYDGIIDIK